MTRLADVIRSEAPRKRLASPESAWELYEAEKARIGGLGLSDGAYERAIAEVARRLGL